MDQDNAHCCFIAFTTVNSADNSNTQANTQYVACPLPHAYTKELNITYKDENVA